MSKIIPSTSLLLLIALVLQSPKICMSQLSTGWKAHDLKRPAPEVVQPGASNLPLAAPSDAIILFDGKDLSKWVGSDGKEATWKIVDGAVETSGGSGDITTIEEFGDCQLHVEWAAPREAQGDGQGRGNSGVYLMNQYEIQVLDSYQNSTYTDGSAGSIYGQFPPLVNASRPPGEWQSYDIIFRRPRFNEQGELLSPATLTVLHNGVLIQDHESLIGPSNWLTHDSYDPSVKEGPIKLQDHGNPVRFRNIWVRRLQEERPKPPTPYRSTTSTVKLSAEQMEQLVGEYDGLSIQREGDSIFLNYLGRRLELVPITESEFEFRKTAGNLKVEFDSQGRAQSISGIIDAVGEFSKQRK